MTISMRGNSVVRLLCTSPKHSITPLQAPTQMSKAATPSSNRSADVPQTDQFLMLLSFTVFACLPFYYHSDLYVVYDCLFAGFRVVLKRTGDSYLLHVPTTTES